MEHSAYSRLFRQWWDSLSQKDRDWLTSQGTTPANAHDIQSGFRELDPLTIESNVPHSQAKEILAAMREMQQEEQEPEQPTTFDISQVIYLIHYILDSVEQAQPGDTARLQAYVLRIVFGVGNPEPQRQAIKTYGIPRSTLNKRVKRMQRLLGLKPSKFMSHSNGMDRQALHRTLFRIATLGNTVMR